MLSGYEIELVNEIHQERLRQAERTGLQLMAEAVTPTRAKKWSIKTQHIIDFLHPLWRDMRHVKGYKPVK